LYLLPSLCRILRLFKQLDFQEQFNIVTQTIILKFGALAHFAALFFSVFALFVVAGMLTFGSDLDEFSSFDKAFYSCYLMMMGDPDVPAAMRTLESSSQVVSFILYYYSFMAIVFFILLNVLLAIIVEG
jgi:hypothetical protein|tara:strand:- start:253 stop:639 length:387 start_codon:yes stop_codon:yes gene_type:complete